MIFIIMLENSSNTLIYKIFSIYPNEWKEVILTDPMEGNIRFLFQIEHARDSQTTINVTSSYSAEIIISTGPFQKTRPIVPIRLGTYQKEYKLYLEYEVLPMDHLGKHDVIVSFVIKRS